MAALLPNAHRRVQEEEMVLLFELHGAAGGTNVAVT